MQLHQKIAQKSTSELLWYPVEALSSKTRDFEGPSWSAKADLKMRSIFRGRGANLLQICTRPVNWPGLPYTKLGGNPGCDGMGARWRNESLFGGDVRRIRVTIKI